MLSKNLISAIVVFYKKYRGFATSYHQKGKYLLSYLVNIRLDL